jgi:hypothetical protein
MLTHEQNDAIFGPSIRVFRIMAVKTDTLETVPPHVANAVGLAEKPSFS